jgi:hypothetical protein
MSTRWIFLFWTFLASEILLVQAPIAFSQETTVYSTTPADKSTSPLEQPQLSLLVGNGKNGKFRFKNLGSSSVEIQGILLNSEIREVDLEIYGGRGFNLGVSARFEQGYGRFTKIKTLQGEVASLNDLSPSVFRTSIGGFVRGQYLLTSRFGVFARGEVGIGPYIMGLAGVAIDAGAQLGVDFYLSEWWGLTASYGYIGSYGIETVASQVKSLKKTFGKKPLFFYSGENLLLIGLKSTYM